MKKSNIILISALLVLLGFTITRMVIQHNKKELTKVIRHYKKERNKEKLAAARFLIENMEGKYSYNGEAYELTRMAYNRLSLVSESERNEAIKNGLDTLRYAPGLTVEFDKDSIKADFLIKHIDSAYKVWKESRWNKDVSFNNFCEYILPYKYDIEGITDYMDRSNKKYSSLLESIYFEGGNRYDALNQNLDSTSLIKNSDNSISKIVRILPDSTGLVFNDIKNPDLSTKTLFIHYRNGKRKSDIHIIINKKDTIKTRLKAMNHWHHIHKRALKVPIQLNKDSNTIEIAAYKDTIAIERIEIAPFEKYYLDDADFKIVDGANYIITNVKNGECLEIENGSDAHIAPVICKQYKGEKYQQFNIQYVAYGFFKIAATHIDKFTDCLDVINFSKENNSQIGMCGFRNTSNQQWAIIPVAPDTYKIMSKLSGKCLESLPKYKQVVQTEYAGLASQHWAFKRADNTIYYDEKYHLSPNSPLAGTRRIAEELDFEWIWLETNLPLLPANDILKTKTGNCVAESQYQLYVLRSQGIPAVIDYFPPGPNSNYGHEWNAIIDKNNKTINCHLGPLPGTATLDMPVTKVFRKTFAINKNSLAFRKGKNESIPELFKNNHLTDVTAEYCPTIDVDIELTKTEAKNYKHAYLCAFSNGKWNPVWWSSISDNKSTFKDMGLNVMYLPVYYTKTGAIQASAYPFLINQDSTITKVIACTDTTQTLILKRKYPWYGGWSDSKMNDGQFQAANKADFSDAINLFTFKGNTEPIFYELPVSIKKKFKYARYMGANSTHSTLSELSFINEFGDEIQGVPIGTPGSYNNLGSTIEKAFDKDILTYFDGPHADGSWVGQKFDNPSMIKTIRFMPRNDGNCVEIGDKYELKYWNNKEWESLGMQIATTDSLIYNNSPTNAVFILHNHTKGKEERIFTVDKDGKQVWW